MFWVEDLACAKLLKHNRLLTSSLRHEPQFKQDDPDDQSSSSAAQQQPPSKKQRFCQQFSFELLLPLSMTREEATLAVELGLVRLRAMPSGQSFVVVEAEDKEEHSVPPLASTTITAKYACFKSLWQQGCTLVDGLKYGVDYLAYARDPLRHHADYMVLVMTTGGELTSPVDLVALATVAGKAKKRLLLATVNSSSSSTAVVVGFTQLQRRHVNPKQQRKRRASKKPNQKHKDDEAASSSSSSSDDEQQDGQL